MIEAYLDKLEQACRAKGIDKFEIRYQCEANAALQVYEQKVSDARDNSSESASLVVLQDGKKGRFETADFDEAKIPLVVDEALANARAVDTEETFFFHDGSGDYHQVVPYRPLAELAELDKIRFLKDLERLAYEADGRINKVIKTCLAEGRRTLTIRNSLGLNLNRETNRAYAYIYLSAKEGDIVKQVIKNPQDPRFVKQKFRTIFLHDIEKDIQDKPDRKPAEDPHVRNVFHHVEPVNEIYGKKRKYQRRSKRHDEKKHGIGRHLRHKKEKQIEENGNEQNGKSVPDIGHFHIFRKHAAFSVNAEHRKQRWLAFLFLDHRFLFCLERVGADPFFFVLRIDAQIIVIHFSPC